MTALDVAELARQHRPIVKVSTGPVGAMIDCTCGEREIHGSDEWTAAATHFAAVLAARSVLASRIQALIQGERCENYTDDWDCAKSGSRTIDAFYEAYRYCWPCRLRAVLADAGVDAEPELDPPGAMLSPRSHAPAPQVDASVISEAIERALAICDEQDERKREHDALRTIERDHRPCETLARWQLSKRIRAALHSATPAPVPVGVTDEAVEAQSGAVFHMPHPSDIAEAWELVADAVGEELDEAATFVDYVRAALTPAPSVTRPPVDVIGSDEITAFLNANRAAADDGPRGAVAAGLRAAYRARPAPSVSGTDVGERCTTCGEPFDSPPCSRSTNGVSGHTSGGGGIARSIGDES